MAAGQSFARARVPLALLTLGYMLNFVDRQLVSVLAEPIKAELSLTDAQMGVLGGPAFALFYTVLGVPIARWADRAPRVRIVAAAVTLWSVATAAFGLARDFGALAAARVAVGVGEAGGVAPSYALIADLVPPHARARAQALFSLGVPTGQAFGFVLGALVAPAFGWRAAFWVAGAAGVVLGPLIALCVREPARGGFDPGGAAALPVRPGLGTIVRALRREPAFWWLTLGAAFTSMASYALAFWLPSLMSRQFGLDLFTRSAALAVVALVGGGAGLWLGGRAADAGARADAGAYGRVAAWGCALTAPVFAVAALSGDARAALPLFAVSTALSLAWLGPVTAAVQGVAPPAMRVSVNAVFLLVLNLIALGLGPPLVGWLADRLGAAHGAGALRMAMLAVLPLYLLAAGLFVAAARALRVRAGEHGDGGGRGLG